MAWQPIETAPTYKSILLFQRFVFQGIVRHDRLALRDGDNAQIGNSIMRKPTHWMPLPEPPADL